MTDPKATGHTATNKGELNWLLDDLVDRVASIRKAVVLSGDGLPTGVSKDLTREDSEHLAAVASGFHSLAKGVGRHFEAGSVRQTVGELDEAGPVVRPYAMTRGRTTSAGQHRLDLIAVVVTEPHVDDPEDDRTLSPEHVDIVEL